MCVCTFPARLVLALSTCSFTKPQDTFQEDLTRLSKKNLTKLAHFDVETTVSPTIKTLNQDCREEGGGERGGGSGIGLEIFTNIFSMYENITT